MTTLSEDQIEVNGLVLGPGTGYEIRQFNPWVAPDVRANDVERGTRIGVASGIDTFGARKLSIAVIIKGSSKDDVRTKAHDLASAFAPSNQTTSIYVNLAGTTYEGFGRTRAASVTETGLYGVNKLIAECRFIMTDPRWWMETEESAAVTWSSDVVSTFSFPVVFPIQFGASQFSNLRALVTASDTYWRATIRGQPGRQIQGPVIEHVEQGHFLKFGDGLVSGSGHPVEINARVHAATWYDKSALRYLTTDSRWFTLTEGSNTIQLRGTGGAGSLNFYWRNALY